MSCSTSWNESWHVLTYNDDKYWNVSWRVMTNVMTLTKLVMIETCHDTKKRVMTRVMTLNCDTHRDTSSFPSDELRRGSPPCKGVHREIRSWQNWEIESLIIGSRYLYWVMETLYILSGGEKPCAWWGGARTNVGGSTGVQYRCLRRGRARRH